MKTGTVSYHHDEDTLVGFLAYDDSTDTQRPAVIVAHDWSGRTQLACDHAIKLAELGYVGFALDMYGDANVMNTLETRSAAIAPFIEDRTKLLGRMQAALTTVRTLPMVDTTRIAAIGFCFGGLCVLDLARANADVRGVVSIHGLLGAPDTSLSPISARVLALHGFDDPMVPPAQMLGFCEEMTKRGADWQLNQYGHTKHAFTNPQAHDEKAGTVYQPKTAERAFFAMRGFLTEVLA